MKRNGKFLASIMMAGMVVPLLGSCGSSKKSITLWVGDESTTFYQKVCNEYVAAHSDFGYNIEVKGVDTGSVAGTITADPSACADIYTVAHDNIGKLASQKCAKPITDEALVKQVTDDNPQGYLDVIYNELEGQKYLFGVPYISQALVLYYNTEKVTPEQAKTFEGLQEAATNANAYAMTLTGDDGFNFSFTVLAKNAKTNATTLKLYENGEKKNCWFQGNDEVASLRWAQRFFANQKSGHGGQFPTDSGWETGLAQGKTLSIIGGAWHYDAAAASLGSKLGVTVLPTYTLTEDDVAGLDQKDGAIAAGDVMQAGTFADCKVLMINATSAPEKYAKEQELIKYLSSKEVQNQSFKEAKNVPAYKGADAYIESIKNDIEPGVYAMAKAQVKMGEYGIAQPFVTPTLNTYYYSMKGPERYKNAILNDGGAWTSLRKIREEMYTIQNIWQHGKVPTTIPEVLPATID